MRSKHVGRRAVLVASIAVVLVLVSLNAGVASPGADKLGELQRSVKQLQATVEDLQDQIDAIEVSAGTLKIVERTESFECPSASSCVFYVKCLDDESLTGGGFVLNDPGNGVLDIWASEPHPTVSNAWMVATFNGGDADTIAFEVTAMCGSVE